MTMGDLNLKATWQFEVAQGQTDLSFIRWKLEKLAEAELENLRELPLTEALWWFIENVSDDHPLKNEMFFTLRERVRNAQEML